MNLVMFSRHGIHYESGNKGDVLAIFAPVRGQTRRFTDITQVSQKTVEDRYGEAAGRALWRREGDVVSVYGTMLPEMMGQRHGLQVFLPQDYAPEGTDVFYFAFGDHYVLHGVRTVSDDNQVDWGISLLKVGEKGVVKVITESLSDRLLNGKEEQVCVAVQGDDETLEDTKRALTPLGVEAMHFGALERRNGAKSLYMHRDYSLLMLTFALFALLMLAGVVAYLVVGKLKLEEVKEDILQLEQQIRRMQQNRPLSHIKDPQSMLNAMGKSMSIPPSSIMHAAADVGSVFGELESVQFNMEGNEAITNQYVDIYADNSEDTSKDVVLLVSVRKAENDLLLFQEEVARSALRERPWVRKVERVAGEGRVQLRVYLRVKKNESDNI